MAQLTITVPDGEVPRALTAFGKILNTVDGNGDPRMLPLLKFGTGFGAC